MPLKVWLLACLSLWLCSCGSARVETVRSLLNVKEAVAYLLETELTEDQHRAVAAVDIAVDPGINLLDRDMFGNKKETKPTVKKEDWHRSTEQAKEAVVYQAAKANAEIDSQFAKSKVWWDLLGAGVGLLLTALGVRGVQTKIRNTQAALQAALQYGKEAMKVDPTDAVAIEQLKARADARKEGTPHEAELDVAMVKMKRST